MQESDPVLTAIRAKRGFASKIGKHLGISREAVWQWSRVPPEHVLNVAKFMKLKPYMVRPDLYPPPKKPRKREEATA